MSTTKSTGGGAEDTTSSASTVQAQPANSTQPRSSTIRFTSDTVDRTQRDKSSRRNVSSSDEATPIKTSDSHVNRNYNTSDSTLPMPSPQPLASTSAASHDTDLSGVTKIESDAPWYKRIADKYGSLTLENKASVARDHLALERTFLAWLRTSLSFASIGVAITQLFRLNASTSRPTKRSHRTSHDNIDASSSLPFSPYLGHAIPAEVLPYLQYVASASTPRITTSTLGPTLLDQMLMLSADGTSVGALDYYPSQFSDGTANKLRHVGKPLGATFIGISVIVLLVGFQRYFEAQHWIIQGKFPASRGSISLVAFVAFALIVASLIVIIVISPTSHET